MYKRQAETVNYKVVAGGVNVFDPTAPVINVSTVYGLPGDTVTVSVSLANNPGIMAAAIKAVYDDSVLELVSVDLNTTNFNGQFQTGAKIVWAGSADNATNGEFITITFKAVSYTHLDVYKRQRLCFALRCQLVYLLRMIRGIR